jgi:protein-disulfide isomerase
MSNENIKTELKFGKKVLFRCILKLLFIMFYFANCSYAIKPHLDYLHQLPDDNILGQANAPVTIIEYSSMGCFACAYLHNDVLPAIEENYINTGKVKLIFRHYPLSQNDIKAATLASCAGSDKYYVFIKALFKTQKNWAYKSSNLKRTLERIAKLGGISKEQRHRCFEDKQLESKILESRQTAYEAKINATPTIIINGNFYNDEISKKRLIKAIDSALKEG